MSDATLYEVQAAVNQKKLHTVVTVPVWLQSGLGTNTKYGYNGLRDKTCFDLNHLKKFWSAYDIQILHLCFLWNVSSYHKRKVHKEKG